MVKQRLTACELGVAGFKTVLHRVATVWRENRDQVLEQGADTIRQLQEFTESQGARCKKGFQPIREQGGGLQPGSVIMYVQSLHKMINQRPSASASCCCSPACAVGRQ